MGKQIFKIFILLAAFFMLPSFTKAAILFEDNFNNQPDWQPTCLICGKNASGYNGGGDRAGTPQNWDYWRNDEYWNPATGDLANQPTLKISDNQYSGQGGKSLQIWNESNNGHSGDGWGADGQLAKNLNGDHKEIFLQLKLKMSPAFQFNWNEANAAQIKAVRFYHTDNTNAPFLDFSGGSNAPIALMKLHYKFYGGFGYDFQHRCDPQLTNYNCLIAYDGEASAYGGNSSWFGAPTFAQWAVGGINNDGWHVLAWQGKINSAPGVADGIIKFWQNGNLLYERNDIEWIGAQGQASTGWNMVSLGGNAFNLFSDPANKAEQWYAIDDVVVSDTPIPNNYVIGGADTTAPAAPTGLSAM